MSYEEEDTCTHALSVPTRTFTHSAFLLAHALSRSPSRGVGIGRVAHTRMHALARTRTHTTLTRKHTTLTRKHTTLTHIQTHTKMATKHRL
jgi:hypothetical protein